MEAQTDYSIANVQPDKDIEGGGHFMVLTHAVEISDMLREQLGGK